MALSNYMTESDNPSRQARSMELRETAVAPDFDLPDGKGFSSIPTPVALSEVIAVSEKSLARFWNDTDFVKRRRSFQILVPFEL
jgi:hypothetical protein